MISIDGFLAVYFSMRKPTAEDRHGARPPAVRMATFAYGSRGLARRGVGRGGDRFNSVGGPRWRRSGGASAGLPPYLCKLHAPPVARAHGCQQRWNVRRGRASGTVDAQRPRLGMISLSLKRSCPLSPMASREQLRLAAPQSRGPIVTHLLRRLVVFSHGCV